MTTMLTKADPHLATIRAAASSIRGADPRLANELEAARFRLYTAISQGNVDGARGWLNTVRTTAELAGLMNNDGVAAAVRRLEGLIQ